MIATGTRSSAAVGGGRLATVAAWLAVVLAAVAIGLVALHAAQSSAGLSDLEDGPLAVGLILSAGWCLVAVGAETWRRGRRPRLAVALAATGVAWLLPDLAAPSIGSTVLFTVGLALGWLWPPLVLLIAATRAAGGLGRAGPRIVVAGFAIVSVGLGLIPTLAFDPAAAGCHQCPANLLSVGIPASVGEAVTRVAGILGVAWAGIAIVVAGRSLRDERPGARPSRAALVIPVGATLALVAVSLGRAGLGIAGPTSSVDHALRIGQAIALIAVAIGVTVEWIVTRQARARVARVVADLAEAPPVGGLRDHLATILDDPDLRLVYPLPNGTTVDAAGEPVALVERDGHRMTPVVRDETTVAWIQHDEAVLRDPAEIDEVVVAARLGLDYERLQAESRAQLETLRAARRRIVAAGDEHRRHLERDLHDGAQQALIALSIELGLARSGSSDDGPLDDATAELGRAIEELREIAHGLHPAVLEDEGVGSAIDALAERSEGRLAIAATIDDRVGAPAERAAYRVVVDAVESTAGAVGVRIERSGAILRVAVTTDEPIPEAVVQEIGDRVGATDGTLALERREGGATTVVAELPCAS